MLVAESTSITQFHRDKYGRELLVDAGLISANPAFLLNDNAFVTNFFEIFMIAEGEGIFHLNEADYPFQKGTMLLLPPGMVRRWGKRSADVDAHYLIFEEEFIQRFFRDELFIYRLHFFNPASPAAIELSAAQYEQFLTILAELQQEINSLRSDSDHLLRALLYYWLIQVNRLYESQHAIIAQPYNNQVALQFKAFLSTHFMHERRVEAYCEMLGVSRATLNKHVKDAYGKSAGALIREAVVHWAKQKLLFTNDRVNEIAYQLNFNEVANFNRLFSRLTGTSPRQFRSRFTN